MKLKHDQISSLFWLIVSVVIIICSVEASLGSLGNPGGGLIPFIAAFSMGVISLSIFISASLGKGREIDEAIFLFHDINWKNLIKTVGALLAFPLLLKPLGFNLTVFVFVLFLAKAIEPRRWVIAILVAFIVTFVCYLLFVRWLQFAVEKGILGI